MTSLWSFLLYALGGASAALSLFGAVYLLLGVAGRALFKRLTQRYAVHAVGYQLSHLERLGTAGYLRAHGRYVDQAEPPQEDDVDDEDLLP